MRQNPRKIPAKAKKVAKPKQKQAPKTPVTDVYVHNAGPTIPQGAVLADVSQQRRTNSYSGQPTFYADIGFVCIDCGRQETWTARQQKWYYEVAKGKLHGSAVRCRSCRAKFRALKAASGRRGDPNPIKHLGTVMKRIRLAIEPALMEAGFRRERTRKISESIPAPLEYTRPGLVMRCGFDLSNKKLLIESLNDQAECQTITKAPLWPVPTTAIEKVVSAIIAFLKPC